MKRPSRVFNPLASEHWGLILAVFLVLSLSACEGPVGPTGPQGAAGAQGVQGPPGLPGAPAGIRWGILVLDADGEGTLRFSNAQVRSSVVNCYTSSTSAGPWLAVAGASGTGIFCGVGDLGSDLGVSMLGGISGWSFLATVAVGG